MYFKINDFVFRESTLLQPQVVKCKAVVFYRECLTYSLIGLDAGHSFIFDYNCSSCFLMLFNE